MDERSKAIEDSAKLGLLACQQRWELANKVGAMVWATLSKVLGVKQNIPEFQ
jgi:hypothetical protein